MRIRYATIDDLDEVYEIEKTFSKPWSRNILRFEIENPSSKFLVLEDENILGFAIFQSAFNEAELLNIAVHEDYRRRGYARLLLEEVLKEEVCEIFLEVHHQNDPAIRLYESMGFKNISMRRDYYGKGSHAYVMRRTNANSCD